MAVKEIITVGQIELRFLLDGDDTNNESVVMEMTIPYGAKVPMPHYHVEVDEILYGLEGITTTIINGVATDIGPGEHIFVPRGAIHHHENVNPGNATTLVVLTPGTIGPRYFHELVALMKKGMPPDPKEMTDIMARHGLVVAAHPAK